MSMERDYMDDQRKRGQELREAVWLAMDEAHDAGLSVDQVVEEVDIAVEAWKDLTSIEEDIEDLLKMQEETLRPEQEVRPL